MEINKNILSIPPYISTSWENILSIFSKENNLIIVLKNGSKITIPNLNTNIAKTIFDTHAKVLNSSKKNATSISFGLPMFSKMDNLGLDSMTNVMQHNPEQKNAPNLPLDMLKKIASLSKIFMEETNTLEMPKPVPNCNCMHCQIAKALQLGAGVNLENLDEEVSDEELNFKTWDIKEEGNKLYTVVNPLDVNEHYNVFLGDPLGCTCGKKNCEHIKAVLKS